MSRDLLRTISFFLLLLFICSLSGFTSAAASAAPVKTGTCCPSDAAPADGSPLPCTDGGCSCALCMTMECPSVAETRAASSVDTEYHPRLPYPTPADFVPRIDYPPELA
ncbi:MAG TPA: hypothetical protein VNX25_04945 [Verrucomicrobiae bacterium]|nr:hypothetical protein [Verrucomicrobiae bacterium]